MAREEEAARQTNIRLWLSGLRGPAKGQPITFNRAKMFDGSSNKTLTSHLLTLQSGKCFHCQTAILDNASHTPNSATMDHIIPREHGGKSIGNQILSCRACNEKRGSAMLSRSDRKRAFAISREAYALCGVSV